MIYLIGIGVVVLVVFAIAYWFFSDEEPSEDITSFPYRTNTPIQRMLEEQKARRFTWTEKSPYSTGSKSLTTLLQDDKEAKQKRREQEAFVANERNHRQQSQIQKQQTTNRQNMWRK